MAVKVSGSYIEQKDAADEPGTSVSVGTSSVEVAADNPDRAEIVVQNDHATQVVYLSLGGTAVANNGIRLNAAGGSWTSNSYTGAVSAIATGAATTVLVTEV